MRKNKVTRLSLMGGVIGCILTNPRKALEEQIDKENQNGWSAIHIEPHRTTNLAVLAAQTIVLIATCGLWTWGGGYIVLFERGDPKG